MTTSPNPAVLRNIDHAAEAKRQYDDDFASREATEAYREKIRDPEIDPGAARPEFAMRTQIEAALHHAGNHETGFYAFPYSPQDAYLDLALNLHKRAPLGALLTSGEHGPVRSVLAMALAGQDDLSTMILLKHGAQLGDDEHPLRVLLSEGSPARQAHGDHYDQHATKKCLEHLSDADVDINTPLDGEPPAFYAAYKLMSENLREDPLEPAGYRYNPITLRACAVGASISWPVTRMATTSRRSPECVSWPMVMTPIVSRTRCASSAMPSPSPEASISIRRPRSVSRRKMRPNPLGVTVTHPAISDH